MVVDVAPALSAAGVHIPYGKGDFLVLLLVIHAEVHVLAVIVGSQNGLHQDVVVHDHRHVEVVGKLLVELPVARRTYEVHGIVERAPVRRIAVVLKVGVLHVVLVPRLTVLVVFYRRRSRVVVVV